MRFRGGFPVRQQFRRFWIYCYSSADLPARFRFYYGMVRPYLDSQCKRNSFKYGIAQEYALCIETLEEVLKEDPGNVELLQYMGRINVQLGDCHTAWTYFSKYVVLEAESHWHIPLCPHRSDVSVWLRECSLKRGGS